MLEKLSDVALVLFLICTVIYIDVIHDASIARQTGAECLISAAIVMFRN